MDISVIIVNYNTYALTFNCLQTLFASQTTTKFEVILIDNGSKDQNPEEFYKAFPSLTLIQNRKNLGFGAANNIGMNAAHGKYLLLLNSDTLVGTDTLQKCWEFLESDFAITKNIGMIGCRLLNPDHSSQPSVFPYLNNSVFTYFRTTNPLAMMIARMLKLDRHANFDFQKTQRVGDISGAFMFLRAEVFRTLGGFDTDFFMYCEDTELCRERISRHYSIYYYPGTSIIHFGGQSAPGDLMYIQSNLSLALLWYKKGAFNYAAFIACTYLNVVIHALLIPFVKSNTRGQIMKSMQASLKIWPYLFVDIPKYDRKINSRREKLVYKESIKAMSLDSTS
jgi:GT2 family glycosyltransferase